jgi:hypothetical protein
MKSLVKNSCRKNLSNDKIKKYRLQIRRLVKEFDWVDEPTQQDFDWAIHNLAKRLVNAKNKYLFLKN